MSKKNQHVVPYESGWAVNPQCSPNPSQGAA
jgi:hypothetical protein